MTRHEAHAGYGDCYTFTAIDPETKLMPCWLVGVRTPDCTYDFMPDLASRIADRGPRAAHNGRLGRVSRRS
jgi:hypothetical protein